PPRAAATTITSPGHSSDELIHLVRSSSLPYQRSTARKDEVPESRAGSSSPSTSPKSPVACPLSQRRASAIGTEIDSRLEGGQTDNRSFHRSSRCISSLASSRSARHTISTSPAPLSGPWRYRDGSGSISGTGEVRLQRSIAVHCNTGAFFLGDR